MKKFVTAECPMVHSNINNRFEIVRLCALIKRTSDSEGTRTATTRSSVTVALGKRDGGRPLRHDCRSKSPTAQINIVYVFRIESPSLSKKHLAYLSISVAYSGVGLFLRGERARQLSDSRWSSPSMNISNPIGIIGALPASCLDVGYLTVRRRADGGGVARRRVENTHKRLHEIRGRKRMKVSEQINDGASTPAAGAAEAMQVDDVIASTSTLDCRDIDYVRTPIIKDTFRNS
ncbi:hypothetical protein EVAR_51489_1 [Eumeta japonica]|uniref:Uncharacterized protein n=1 Tax=Eumeta variegata TaxID=151549 RepID=A0A4C1XAU5_EUMVA|nr:hypothetical protein EVAR_51489_1 [Eumeta japonica]